MSNRSTDTEGDRPIHRRLLEAGVRILSICAVALGAAQAAGCIADKALTEGAACPAEQPDGRVCSGAVTCPYDYNNLCAAGMYATVCSCVDGMMYCDPQAGERACQLADVPQDATANDALDAISDADAATVVEFF